MTATDLLPDGYRDDYAMYLYATAADWPNQEDLTDTSGYWPFICEGCSDDTPPRSLGVTPEGWVPFVSGEVSYCIPCAIEWLREDVAGTNDEVYDAPLSDADRATAEAAIARLLEVVPS